ncbi:MAG: hypothetical protein PWQ37_1110 [Candidatus Petromonas sp.]|jgi:hypothetical protein|nr:hypothetical protein [Candidatus Petromonas sp.]
MKINGIEEIKRKGCTIDVVLDVDFDDETANQWEFIDPITLVVYKAHGDLDIDYMELVDNGMKVHGYEFSKKEEKQIMDFLKKNNIEDKVKNYLN